MCGLFLDAGQSIADTYLLETLLANACDMHIIHLNNHYFSKSRQSASGQHAGNTAADDHSLQ